MAFGAGTCWEVNSGGSDVNNAGGFDTGATFATDLAATLATSAAPVVTSASYNFITRDNAKYLYVGGGTNWTRGMYPITSTSGNAATLNAAIGSVVLYNAVGQPTGLNTVAGCATVASPTGGTWGIDYSRGTTPVFSYTDMVIGATTTQFTSVANPAGPHLIGNFIAVTSGTGFTVQWVEVTAFTLSGLLATCDKSLGTTLSTGGNGGLGGALASPGKAGALHIGSNFIALCAAGSIYGMSASNNVAGGKLSLAAPSTLFGYTSNRFPLNTDAKPQVKPTANSYTLVYFGSQAMCRNIAFINPDAHTANVCTQTDNGNSITESCTADSFATAFSVTFGAAQFHNLYISNIQTSGVGISAATASGTITGVEIRGGSTSANGINLAGSWSLSDFIVSGVNGIGVNVSGLSVSIKRGIVYGCGSDGVNTAGNSNATIANVHCEGNTGIGFNAASAYTLNRLINCSAYNNTGGNVVAGLLAAPMTVQGFITLTSTAFTSTAGHDFSLNNTAGGGAVLRAAGFPGLYPGGTTTSYSDIGAAQHQATSAVAYRPSQRTYGH